MVRNKEKITDPICQAIEIIGRQLMSEMSFDITETAIIVDNSKKDQGQYTVRSSTGTAEYTAYSTDTNLSKNTAVYVTIPKGDYNEQKLIVSKKTSESEKPIVVKNSIDDLIELVGTTDFFDAELINSLSYSLLANGENFNKIILPQTQLKQPLSGYTRFGIRADFRSWIPEAVSGDYGLVVHLYSELLDETVDEEDIEIINDKKYINNYIYLNTEQMFGNPYDFQGYFPQDYMMDISGLGVIDYISIEFRQEGNFVDKDGTLLPTTQKINNSNETLPDNLFISNIQLSMGIDKSEITDGQYINLYTLNSDKYTGSTADIKKDNKKVIRLRWVKDNEVIEEIPKNDIFNKIKLNSFSYGTYGMDTFECYLVQFDNTKYLEETKEVVFFKGEDEIFKIANKTILKFVLNIENKDKILYLQWTGRAANSTTNPVLYFLDIDNIVIKNAKEEFVKAIDSVDFPYNTRIEWFRYKMGAASATTYSGVEWEKLNNNDKFTYDLYPDINLAKEQIKAIITQMEISLDGTKKETHYRSNIIEFSNSQDVSGINAGKYMSALTIRCDDNSYGNYFIYDQGYGLLDQSQSKEIKTITAHFDLDKTGDEIDSPLLEADSIAWIIPASNTMINVVDSGINGMIYKSLTETRGQYTEIIDGYRTEYSSDDENKKVVVKIDQTKAGEEKWYDAQGNLFRTLTINPDGSAVGEEIFGNYIKIINFSKYGYKDNKLVASQPKYTFYDRIENNTYDSLKPLRVYDKINGLITIFNYYNSSSTTDEKINNKLQYRISSTYSPSYNNNTIQCKIMKDGVNYTTSKELSFGLAGTADTDYTLVLDFDDNKHAMVVGSTEATSLTLRLYGQDGKEITDFTKDIDVQWSLYSGDYNELIFNSENLVKDTDDKILYYIEKSNMEVKLNSTISDYSEKIIIVQASINWADRVLIAYLPIPITSNSDWKYINGPTWITYLSDGSINYNSQEYQVISNNSLVNGISASIICNDSTNTKYHPEINNNILKPLGFYIEQGSTRYAVKITSASASDDSYWINPIMILQNKYPSRGINKWDGKSLQINETDGSIYSTMLVAGSKNSNGQFSGVMLGDADTKGNEGTLSKQTGIYGFRNGAMSYAFKEDGTAFIGESGQGRIEFNGESGIIQSSNYSSGISGMKINLKDGKIEAIDADLSGMINATSGSFNNVKFETGTLGGWLVKDRVLKSPDENMIIDPIDNGGSIILKSNSGTSGLYFESNVNDIIHTAGSITNSSGILISPSPTGYGSVRIGTNDNTTIIEVTNSKIIFRGDVDFSNANISGFGVVPVFSEQVRT